MKYLALSLLLISTAHAQVHQNGYIRQDGIQVKKVRKNLIID
jgi:hypothetical protein